MKKLVQKFRKQALLFALGCLIFTSCSKDDTPDIEKQDPKPNPDGIAQDSLVVVSGAMLTLDGGEISKRVKSVKNGEL